MWKMDIIDSYGPLFPYPKSLKFKFNLELHHVWFLLVTRRLETWPQLQKKQTAFFTLWLPYRFKRKLFFFPSSMLQVWSMVNLEIKFQIRLSNGILMDCWPISCGMAACKSGWNTINFLGSVLKSFLDKKGNVLCKSFFINGETSAKLQQSLLCFATARSQILCVDEHHRRSFLRTVTILVLIS